MLSIADIVNAVAFPFSVWRTLHGILPEMCDGRPAYVAGNAAVSFRVQYRGERKMLKCYIRTNENLRAIYGEAFRPQELCVVDIVGRHRWVDCLLMDYVEGRTLDEAICLASTEKERLALADSFDRMACELLAQERAHGDLKPENIIV
ncbi:MAG: protein kinase, partial [Alistipes sp.]|nr:protein kinase [Alistipes sp.]